MDWVHYKLGKMYLLLPEMRSSDSNLSVSLPIFCILPIANLMSSRVTKT